MLRGSKSERDGGMAESFGQWRSCPERGAGERDEGCHLIAKPVRSGQPTKGHGMLDRPKFSDTDEYFVVMILLALGILLIAAVVGS